MTKHPNPLLANLPTTIFETMSRLSVQTGAVNLGQGFPEGLEPPAMLARLAQIATVGPHQYPSMMGTPALREAVARHEKRFWSLDIDPAQVMVTSGATEALAACLLALTEPGDEVVLFEPAYDSYQPIIALNQAVAKPVRLNPPDWSLPRDGVAKAFGPRTKALLLNSPTNPTGKVFDAAELAFIAELAQANDAFVICDEVYEHLVYDRARHIPLMSLPGMAERTVKVGSAGKIFSLTGWKVGWVTAPPALIGPIAKAHQYLTFTTAPVLQEAVAWGLDHLDDYYLGLAGVLAARRDRLASGLQRLGFDVAATSGSYFLTAGYGAFQAKPDDEGFCRRLVTEAGVTAIPVSAFYHDGRPSGAIRFCFAKTDPVLDEALTRLDAWTGR